jgi:hypothetical protein
MPDKMKELQTVWDAWNATLAKPFGGKARAMATVKPGTPANREEKEGSVVPPP